MHNIAVAYSNFPSFYLAVQQNLNFFEEQAGSHETVCMKYSYPAPNYEFIYYEFVYVIADSVEDFFQRYHNTWAQVVVFSEDRTCVMTWDFHHGLIRLVESNP